MQNIPSPIDILLDPVALSILGSYLFLILWEEIFPARKLPVVKFWRLKGLTFFFSFFFLSSYLPMFTDAYLAEYQLFDLSEMGLIPSTIIAFLVLELVLYVYHRTVHSFNFLFRSFHQVHHSAERLDCYGALYHIPLDMIGFTLVGSVSFPLILGVSPEAITIVILLVNFLSFFQHANIKTAHWIGYFFQRPESHSYHHGRGIHRNNYADFPLIDMIFGTFINPKNYQKETGFYNGASSRILDMFMLKDVSVEK